MNEYQFPAIPEEAFRLTWNQSMAAYTVNKPNIDTTDVFLREQLEDYGFECARVCTNHLLKSAAEIMRLVGKETKQESLFELMAKGFEDRLSGDA